MIRRKSDLCRARCRIVENVRRIDRSGRIGRELRARGGDGRSRRHRVILFFFFPYFPFRIPPVHALAGHSRSGKPFRCRCVVDRGFLALPEYILYRMIFNLFSEETAQTRARKGEPAVSGSRLARARGRSPRGNRGKGPAHRARARSASSRTVRVITILQ